MDQARHTDPEYQASTEIAILRQCMRPSGSLAEILARNEPDWDRLHRLAARHGLIPLLHRLFIGCGQDRLPTSFADRLHRESVDVARANLALTGELFALMAALDAEGLEAFPYKGPALAQRAYGNVGLRPIADLDIFVRRKDIPQAVAILENRGYSRLHPFSADQEAVLASSDYQATLRHNATGSVVELHWDFAWPHFSVRLDLDGIWTRLETIEIGGRPLPCPSDADLITILCVHGSKHCWDRLEWIAALARIVDQNRTLNWDELLAEASRRRVRRVLLLGLRLCQDLLGNPLPDHVSNAIARDPAVAPLASEVYERHESDDTASISPQGILRDASFQMRSRERLRDRARFAVRFATDPTAEDIMPLRLGPRLAFLYRILRPLRLGAKYARP